MTRLLERLETGLGRAAAFAYAADWDHQAEWDPNTRSSRRLDSGPLGVGATFELQVKVGPGTRTVRYRITEYDPDTRVVFVGDGPGIWSRDTITFSDLATGTQMGYEAEIRLGGLLGLLQPLMGRAFASIAKGASAGLRRELDRRVATPPEPVSRQGS